MHLGGRSRIRLVNRPTRCPLLHTQRPSSQTPAATQAGAEQLLVQCLAGKLMLMNQSTIQMSEMVEQRASSEEVQQFAQMLAKSHEQLNEELRGIAPEVAASTKLESGEQRTAAFRGTSNRDNSAGEKTGEAGLVLRLLELERDATRNYIQSSSQMLQRYQGQDFDMGFLGFQIRAHTWALAELQAMEGTGDEKFQQIIKTATSKAEQHLQQARELAKQFEDDRRQ